MPLFSHLLILLSILNSYHATNHAQTPVSRHEISGLKSLYDATDGIHWRWRLNHTRDGIPWNFTIPDPNPCVDHWQGVNCNCVVESNCTIIGLRLVDYKLNGTIPIGITNLTSLFCVKIANQWSYGYNTWLSGLKHVEVVRLGFGIQRLHRVYSEHHQHDV